jgi:2-oxoglutarate ferredoxin oxidoreductase subunit beta
VARWTILHVREFQDAVLRAMSKRGFCFIEVLAPCPTSFGKSNNIGDGLHEVEIYRQRCRIENGAQNLEDLDIDLLDESRPITVGNFVDVDRRPFMK